MATSSGADNALSGTEPNHSALEDHELLVLIADQRDRRALAELYHRYRAPLGRFLRRGMYETKILEEVYNDVMLAVWQSASRFRGASKVSTWIFGIAYRTRSTHTKKESRHTHAASDDLIDSAEIVNEHTLDESLHAAISELSEQHRTVVELAYFHGYSMTEIANIVDCPQNTVKTRLFHARKQLRTLIKID